MPHLLEADQISKHYGGVYALRQAHFELRGELRRAGIFPLAVFRARAGRRGPADGGGAPDPDGLATTPPVEMTPAPTRQVGVFVTVRQDGKLRGCVGNVGECALAQAIPDMALAAALDDHRFPPLTANDCEDQAIEIEISVLFPMKRIRGRESYRLQGHGGPFLGVARPQGGPAGRRI